MAEEHGTYLSHRASKIEHLADFLTKYMYECMGNQWSPENPDGYANFGTAENYINEDLIVEKVNYF